MEQNKMSQQLQRIEEHPGGQQAPKQQDSEKANYPDETCEDLRANRDFLGRIWSNLTYQFPLQLGSISHRLSILAFEEISAPEVDLKSVEGLGFGNT